MSDKYLPLERQKSIFDAGVYGDTEVHCVGVGGNGSNAVWPIVCMGMRVVHAYDAGILKTHNPDNQRYPMVEIGNPKVEALQREVMRWTGVQIHAHNEFITGPVPMKGVVLMGVHKNAIRRDLHNWCIRGNKDIKLLLDMRMGGSLSSLYTIDPRVEEQERAWEAYTKDLPEGHEQLADCGGAVTVGLTTLRLGLEVGEQIVRWAKRESARAQGKNINSEVPLPFLIEYDILTDEYRREIWW